MISCNSPGQEKLRKHLGEAKRQNNVVGTVRNTLSHGAQNRSLQLGLLLSQEDFNQCFLNIYIFNYVEQL